MDDDLGSGLRRVGDRAADEWKDYASGWTTWNHVRTIAPLISTMLLIAALSREG